MNSLVADNPKTVRERARASGGTSSEAIYQMVVRAIAEHIRPDGHGRLIDVGCGSGRLWPYVSSHFDKYVGADAVRYDDFPAHLPFYEVDLDSGRIPIEDETGDVVAAVETIEHLENPRAFMRELVRLTRPGGWTLVTTPNQLSLLSKLTLLVFNEINAFRAGSYPAHLTALLEVDLRRIATECGLTNIHIEFSQQGRISGTSTSYPHAMSRMCPRWLSDNVIAIGQKSLRGMNA